MDIPEDLIQAQIALENAALDSGVTRFLQRQDQTAQDEGDHSRAESYKLTKGAIPLVSEEILKWTKDNDRCGKGRTHTALSILKSLDSDKLAYAALNAVLNGAWSSKTITHVQNNLGRVVEQEVLAMDLETEAGRKVAKRVQTRVSKQGTAKNRLKAFNKLVADNLQDPEEWAPDFRVRVAEPLLNAVLLALPDFFELATVSRGKGRMETLVRFTEEAVRFLTETREAIAWSQPIHPPMIAPPRPWEALDTGCYYDPKVANTVKLIRTHHKEHELLLREAIGNGQMTACLEAINVVQATPWVINSRVLDVVEYAFNEGLEIKKFPSRITREKPSKLPQDKWEAMSDTEKKGHRIELREIEEHSRKVAADVTVFGNDIRKARDLETYDRFYFPHNLDFRGRVYPVCHFSHQRADHIKAMLQFAEGCPLGDTGGSWLQVHLANCGDFEKVSKGTFDARIQWVVDNQTKLVEAGKDPHGTTDFWTKADKPFSFLAACFEFADWYDTGFSDDYISHLPIALDGSNSGIQHYSAAMRAKEEAALVSLLPCDTPADLYQSVATDVLSEVRREALEGNLTAQVVLKAGVDRSLVKRNVMTFAYSSEQYGFRQQLMEDTMRPINTRILMGTEASNKFAMPRKDSGQPDGGFTAAGYIAAKVYGAVTRTVPKASEGMDFFKKVASVLAHEAKPLVWVSPIGIPVLHKYCEWETKAVQLFLYDRSVPVVNAGVRDKVDEEGRVIRQVRANIRTKPLERIDKDKARSAVAPNVIHSMDAAHLMLTVLEAKDRGIINLALIHDSFGTHAGRTAEFFDLIRDAFVGLYENYCPFEEILESAKLTLSPEGQAKLPPVPEKGDMDLTQVREALYAFA